MQASPEYATRVTQAQQALIRARAGFTLGGRGIPAAIEALESIEPRELSASDTERYRFVFAEALIARGNEPDMARARMLLTELGARVTDPFRRDLVRALTALASPPPATPTTAGLR